MASSSRPLLFALAAATALTACRSAPPAPPPTAEARARGVADPLAADVVRLESADFVARARAGERLVAAGPRALDVLGRAASDTGPTKEGDAVIQAILSDAAEPDLRRVLRSPWAAVRRGAVEEVGRRGRWGSIPALLARLEDEDAGVRGSAAASLRRMTNEFFGYDASAPAVARGRAAGAWREWWAVEGRLRLDEPGATPSG